MDQTPGWEAGRDLLDQGNATAAVATLNAFVKRHPDSFEAHYHLGRAYRELGKTENARTQWETCRYLAPEHAAAAAALAALESLDNVPSTTTAPATRTEISWRHGLTAFGYGALGTLATARTWSSFVRDDVRLSPTIAVLTVGGGLLTGLLVVYGAGGRQHTALKYLAGLLGALGVLTGQAMVIMQRLAQQADRGVSLWAGFAGLPGYYADNPFMLCCVVLAAGIAWTIPRTARMRNAG